MVVIAWVVIAVGFGFFAPRVETALSGAGWEASGSQSVQARQLIDKNFQGQSSSALMVVVHSDTKTVSDPAFQKTVVAATSTLKGDTRVRAVVAPQAGMSISKDGHTAIIQAGAAKDSNTMVRAADDLKTKLHACRPTACRSRSPAPAAWSTSTPPTARR